MSIPASASKKIPKGQALFAEGEASTSMYLIRSGMIRIFKKKGDAQIEIDTLRTGQIVGEMSFLDGNPRSASGEALMDTELVEISQTLYKTTMEQVPEWLKVLVKATVARLRATTTKVKNLETASSEVNYSADGGKRSFVFLSTHDCLKAAAAVILVAARNGVSDPAGVRVKVSLVERYATQVMGLPAAKTASFLDVLRQGGITDSVDNAPDFVVKDLNGLESFIHFVADQNLLEPSKRTELRLRGYLVMGLLSKHLETYPLDAEGKRLVNVMEIHSLESQNLGKEAFRMEDFGELVKAGFATPLNVQSGTVQTTVITDDFFQKSARIQRLLKIIDNLNHKKSK